MSPKSYATTTFLAAAVRKRRAKEPLLPYFTQSKFNTGVAVGHNNPTACALATEIDEKGRIPYSRFMDVCLYGDDGYYSKGKATISGLENRERDFITSPEASDMFGWTICLAAYGVWEKMGKPEHFDIVEQGAGNGTLAATLLDFAKRERPDFYQAIAYQIQEYSDQLIKKQRERVKEHQGKISWRNTSAYEMCPESIEGLIFSNELLDAFPVERVIRIDGEVRQKYVTIEDKTWVEVWDTPTDEVLEFIKKHRIGIKEGIEEDINIHSIAATKHAYASLKRGALLTIDYGGLWGRGTKNHTAVRFYGWHNGRKITDENYGFNPVQYEAMGEIDMTTDVDFFPLIRKLDEMGAKTGLHLDQKEFLFSFGAQRMIRERIEQFNALTTWGEVEELQQLCNGYTIITDNLGDYRTEFVFKGIGKVPTEEYDDKYKPRLPSVKIPLAISDAFVVVDTSGRQNPNARFGQNIIKRDKFTERSYRLPDIPGMVVYQLPKNGDWYEDHSQGDVNDLKILLDLRKRENLDTLIANAT